MSKPTCLGIVTSLTDHGYLTRDPSAKTYALGPALIAAGAAARQNFASCEIAGRLLAQLGERYAAPCTASAIVGNEVMVLVSTAPSWQNPAVKVGQRYPFAPPVGLMYVLWDDEQAFERWLTLRPTLPVLLDQAHLRTVVSECRERGYLVEGMTEAGRRLHTLMAGVAAYDLPEEVRAMVGEMASTLGERIYLGADMSARGRYPVGLLAAPTYDAAGKQELVLTLGVAEALTRAQVSQRGRALVAVAEQVTRSIGGVRPDGPKK